MQSHPRPVRLLAVPTAYPTTTRSGRLPELPRSLVGSVVTCKRDSHGAGQGFAIRLCEMHRVSSEHVRVGTKPHVQSDLAAWVLEPNEGTRYSGVISGRRALKERCWERTVASATEPVEMMMPCNSVISKQHAACNRTAVPCLWIQRVRTHARHGAVLRRCAVASLGTRRQQQQQQRHQWQ